MDRFSQDSLSENAVATDSAANRNDSRDSLLLAAQFRIAGNKHAVPVRIRNLSAGGLMAEVDNPLSVGTGVEIDVRGVGWIPGRVAWVAAGRIGIAFDGLIDPLAARKPVVTVKQPTIFKPIKPILK
jgi:hypothetical protein